MNAPSASLLARFSIRGRAAALALALGAVACGESAPGTENEDVGAVLDTINAHPETLEEASATLTVLDGLAARHPGHARIREVFRQLEWSIDRLNGIVATIAISERHAVDFFSSDDGVLTARERKASDAKSVLEPLADEERSVLEMFRALAPELEPPDELTHPPACRALQADETSAPEAAGVVSPSGAADGAQGAAIGTKREALTAADGQWFRDNRCPHTGDFQFCYPSHWNGAYAQGHFKRSRFVVAPFAGDHVSVRRLANGSLRSVDPVYPGEDKAWYQEFWGEECFCVPWPLCTCRDIRVKGTHRWEVADAAGDGFHWGGNMYN